jgi:exosortase
LAAKALTKNDSAGAPEQSRLRDATGLTTKTTTLTNSPDFISRRWLFYGCWIVFSCLVFARTLANFAQLYLSNDDSSYLILIPGISAGVLFLERRKVFQNLSYDKVLSGSLVVLSACVALSVRLGISAATPGLELSGYILSLVLFWVAGFAFLFGRSVSKAAYFPLLFLFLMVPLPSSILDRITYYLQVGSAWITGAVFDLLGVPALRDGLVFHLAGVSIEVAKECSGIRSSMVLLILALVIVHLCLRKFWTKVLFVASGLFMMILKNGIRIATLTILATHVDPGFLYGRLHHQGGIAFFLFALLLLVPVLRLLQSSEALGVSNSTVLDKISRGCAYGKRWFAAQWGFRTKV